MLDSAPDYYQYAALFQEVQQAIADEIDLEELDDKDVQDQLTIGTATWGLKYWEQSLGIKIVTTDSYDIRRSRVLSKWRGFGNFSASLIKSVCEAFTNGEVAVKIRVPQQEVVVTFIGKRGIPPNLEDLKAQLSNIALATLGLEYKFTWIVWEELDKAYKTWDEVDAKGLTWDEWDVISPYDI